jgi:hypothetical protein
MLPDGGRTWAVTASYGECRDVSMGSSFRWPEGNDKSVTGLAQAGGSACRARGSRQFALGDCSALAGSASRITAIADLTKPRLSPPAEWWRHARGSGLPTRHGGRHGPEPHAEAVVSLAVMPEGRGGATLDTASPCARRALPLRLPATPPGQPRSWATPRATRKRPADAALGVLDACRTRWARLALLEASRDAGPKVHAHALTRIRAAAEAEAGSSRPTPHAVRGVRIKGAAMSV